jgi:hypothetical protein
VNKHAYNSVLPTSHSIHLLYSIIEQVREVIREDNHHLFTVIQEMSHLTSVLSANTPRMPRITWDDDSGEELMFDGRLITMTSFRQMFAKLVEDTKKMLLNDVLLGLELPDLQQERIWDTLACNEVGYSFIMDHRNNFKQHNKFLIQAMLSDKRFNSRFHYAGHSNKDGIAWNKKGVLDWLSIAEKCLGNLFACAHYGSGQPARGTELATLSLINTVHHARSFYWFRGYLNIITTYNKTQTNSDKPRVISRSLPPPVGELFILWMTLVVPTLITIASSLIEPRAGVNFRDYIFTSLTGTWETDDFSSILGSVSGEPVAKYGLGHSMGIADTRHFLISIMRRHLLGTSNRNFLEDYFNEQSGHGDDVAINYAVSFDTIRSVSEDHLARFVEVSKRQHDFLFPHLAPVHHVSTVSAMDETSVGIPHLDYQQLAHTLAPIVAPQLATMLKPRMEQNIAEAFAAIFPIHQLPSSSSLPLHHLKVPNSPESRLGMHIVDAERVVIPPDRYIELRALMGKDASFLSVEQACAVELAAQRQHDLLVVLGTSGGKSLVFMAAAVNKAEIQAGLATVVILPLVALLDDMANRLRKKGISST